MADVMTQEQRSRCMAAIRSKDTKPEILVRKFLFSKGLRFRVNSRKLPGTPDIVLKKYKAAVFIDGCFWHGHGGCRYYRLPKSNVEFWQTKIERNIERDKRTNNDLSALGWRVIRIWECEVRGRKRLNETLENLYHAIVGKGSACAVYEDYSSGLPTAAEPQPSYGGKM